MNSSTKFASITPGQQNCKVFGRLIRLWDSKNMNSKAADPFISIDGIILAEDGTMAQITIPRKVEKQFRPSLQVGSVYIFADLNAVDIAHKKYVYHHQKYILLFKSSSKVYPMQSQGTSIPQFAFDFCPFDKLSTKDIQTKPLLDLIGVISYVGPYDYASPTSQYRLRKVQIRNQEKVFSYQWEIPTLQQQQPQVVRLSPIEAAGKLYKLAEISAMPISSFQGGATYSCIAKIEAIIQSSNWYYKTCKTCGQGYNNNLDTQRCACTLSAPKPMYKLPLKITDGTTSMDTIAFTSVAEDLVEKTASEASQNMNLDASDHAVALDQAIGKTRLFTIGMNHEYFSKFSINYVLKKSYPVDEQNLNTTLSAPQDPTNKNALVLPSPMNTHHFQRSDITTPYAQSSSIVTDKFVHAQSECSDIENPISSNTKRKLLFDKDTDDNNQSNITSDKRQKKSLEDSDS